MKNDFEVRQMLWSLGASKHPGGYQNRDELEPQLGNLDFDG